MKLTTERIVDAGMATFAEVGYQGLSMRQVAERLDAQAGSLYYHVRNKDVLLRLMAERVAEQAYAAGTHALAELPESASWRDSIEAQAITLRMSIQRHRGGAVLLAESPKMLSTGALSLMERLLDTLRLAGAPEGYRGLAADTVLSYVTGFVLQEQGDSPTPAISQEQFAELRQRFPQIMSGPRDDEDAKFVRSVRLICDAIELHIPEKLPVR